MVALVLAGRPVVDTWPAVAVRAASAEPRVEGVEQLGVQAGHHDGADHGADVLGDQRLVGTAGGVLHVEQLQVPVDELVDGRPGARVALLVHLVEQAGHNLLRLGAGGALGLLRRGRAERDDSVR
ncbi:MAG TPA: hypothetical protein VLJ59_06275 [Mycobacteriales bacterium]|nr:hypothetical protein [Mycobacteriales bacterium]